MSRIHRSAVLLATLGLGLASTAVACGDRDDDPGTAAAGASPSISLPTESTSTEPSAGRSQTPEVETPDPGGTGTLTLTDRLLATSAVPGLNAEWTWLDGETGPAGPDGFGLCAKVDLASIGALEAVERTYFPPVDSDDNAAEQIAEFPDSRTAATAASVLRSWHRQCRDTLAKPRARIGAITPVAVDSSGSSGYWYLVSYPEGQDEVRFHAYGVATSGTRIAVMTIDSGGQDYNYTAGQEPMVGMVRAAAAELD